MMIMISQSPLEKQMLWFYSLRTALRTALCESIRYQAKSEQNVRQDLIPRVRAKTRVFVSLRPFVFLSLRDWNWS